MRARPVEARPRVGDDGRPVFAARVAAFDASGIGPEPAPFAATLADDWLFSFFRTVEDNAVSDAGLDIDPAENARLGAILAVLKSPVDGPSAD
ncbi:putative bacterial virulence factor [Methylobrevis pamukkalensis]|uniref:Putative bacterial virulence factor n=2 Tax=Methylobrevis pamukkalensis TaxID=1439726 RepID=A0A1E3H304_9HYPH|nr:putative bacterial virulence factor [Methylobrevis pamukkalensis]